MENDSTKPLGKVIRIDEREIRGHLDEMVRGTVEETFATCMVVPELVELRNIALLGELIVLCARARRESRGLHYTLDYPDLLPEARDTVLVPDNTPTRFGD